MNTKFAFSIINSFICWLQDIGLVDFILVKTTSLDIGFNYVESNSE